MEDRGAAGGNGITPAQGWRLARPFSLPAAAVPPAVGAALLLAARRPVAPLPLALVALVALLLQAATNMANEYFDFRRGVDRPDSVGIAGLLVRGEAAPEAVRRAFLWTFAAALACGLALAAVRGWILLPAGALAAAVGIAYSAGPRPLSSTPWGEAVVFATMGVGEVLVSEYAGGGCVTLAGAAAGLSVGCTVAAILLGNNVRDRAGDAAVGRRTLAVVLGAPRTTGLLCALVVCGAAGGAVLAAAGLLPPPAALTLLALPAAWVLCHRLRGEAKAGHWNAVPALARFHLLCGLLLAGGLALGGLAPIGAVHPVPPFHVTASAHPTAP